MGAAAAGVVGVVEEAATAATGPAGPAEEVARVAVPAVQGETATAHTNPNAQTPSRFRELFARQVQAKGEVQPTATDQLQLPRVGVVQVGTSPPDPVHISVWGKRTKGAFLVRMEQRDRIPSMSFKWAPRAHWKRAEMKWKIGGREGSQRDIPP